VARPSLSAAAAPAPDPGLGTLRWLAILHGALTILFGGLLLFVPGKTLTFVATLTGIWFCLFGVLGFVRVLAHGLTRGERVAGAGIALLAIVAGTVVIARPEGSVRAVAIAGGLYLVVLGVTAALSRSPGESRGLAILRGGLAVLAGVALLVWPDISVGVAAAIYGAFLLALGAAEVFFVVRMGDADDSV
jgi:uncharacterized membrane protein HdeD (DUF308 family)